MKAALPSPRAALTSKYSAGAEAGPLRNGSSAERWSYPVGERRSTCCLAPLSEPLFFDRARPLKVRKNRDARQRRDRERPGRPARTLTPNGRILGRQS